MKFSIKFLLAFTLMAGLAFGVYAYFDIRAQTFERAQNFVQSQGRWLSTPSGAHWDLRGESSLSVEKFVLLKFIDDEQLDSIRGIDLSGTSIGDEHLEFLNLFPNIETLDLRKTQVTADGIKAHLNFPHEKLPVVYHDF